MSQQEKSKLLSGEREKEIHTSHALPSVNIRNFEITL